VRRRRRPSDRGRLGLLTGRGNAAIHVWRSASRTGDVKTPKSTTDHTSTHVTETVYRHVIIPAIRGSAAVMDQVFGKADDGEGQPGTAAATLSRTNIRFGPDLWFSCGHGVRPGIIAGDIHLCLRDRPFRAQAAGRAVPMGASIEIREGTDGQYLSYREVGTYVAPLWPVARNLAVGHGLFPSPRSRSPTELTYLVQR